MSDAELLQRYAANRCEASFAELVSRNINLVFSAALRQTGGNHDLAEEVAQSVFTDLARKASTLTSHSVLAGWLYTSTRFASAKRVRAEQRRIQREQQALYSCMETSPEPEPSWDQIAPVLDEAMHELRETERTAVLLRYFEKRPFGEVGKALGLKEDAARMRVERALEKLRHLLQKRGVASTSTALAAILSGQALSAAPAGLAATISTGAVSAAAGASAGAFAILEFITMSKIKAGIVVTMLAGASVPFILQHREAGELRKQNQELQRRYEDAHSEITPLKAENARLSALAAQARQAADRSNEVFRLRDEVTRLRAEARAPRPAATVATSGDPLEATLVSLGQRAAKLREAVNRMPERSIPELAHLKEKDWIDAVQFTQNLETEEEIRDAFNQLRSRAKSTVGVNLQGALKKHLESNDQRMPQSLAELAPLLDPPLTPEIMARYQLALPGGSQVSDRNVMLIEEIAPPVDDEYETRYSFSYNGTTSRSFSRISELLQKGAEAYANANNGLLPRDPSQLAAFVDEAIPSERIQKFLAKIPPHAKTIDDVRPR